MLKIYVDALEVVRELVPIVAPIDQHDGDLARQLKKARSSVPLNVAEGVREGIGERVHRGTRVSTRGSRSFITNALRSCLDQAVFINVLIGNRSLRIGILQRVS